MKKRRKMGESRERGKRSSRRKKWRRRRGGLKGVTGGSDGRGRRDRRRLRGQSRARLRTLRPNTHTNTPYSCTTAASSSVATFLVSRMSLMLMMTVTTRKSTAPACGRNNTQQLSWEKKAS